VKRFFLNNGTTGSTEILATQPPFPSQLLKSRKYSLCRKQQEYIPPYLLTAVDNTSIAKAQGDNTTPIKSSPHQFPYP